jgi:transcription antitermination factor NusG
MNTLTPLRASRTTGLLDRNSEDDLQWYALKTRAKCEKLVAKLLERQKFTFYLPIQRLFRYYKRKVRKVELPLIPNYIFVQIRRTDYVHILQMTYVVNFVRSQQVIMPVPQAEIDLLKKICDEPDLVVTVNQGPLVPGDQVEIVRGNLTGLKGVLMEKEGKHTFQVALDYLGHVLNMSIDSSLIKRCPPQLPVNAPRMSSAYSTSRG